MEQQSQTQQQQDLFDTDSMTAQVMNKSRLDENNIGHDP